MERTTPIIVKRGFFSTLAYGVSGVLITAIVCGTGIVCYGFSILDRKSHDLASLGKELVATIPGILEALPPALGDAINDRRDPGYRSQLDIDVSLASDLDGRWLRPVVTVTNRGAETVSLLALRLVLADESGVPVDERVSYAATPLAVRDEWRGPILPGETRTYATRLYGRARGVRPMFEVTEVRVWNGTPERDGRTRLERAAQPREAEHEG